jgi:putative flippase GtrA
VTDLTPRPGRPPSRRERERRAYRLAVVGGIAAVLAVVGVVLAAVGVIGFFEPVIAAIVAIVCAVLFRRTVGR